MSCTLGKKKPDQCESCGCALPDSDYCVNGFSMFLCYKCGFKELQERNIELNKQVDKLSKIVDALTEMESK